MNNRYKEILAARVMGSTVPISIASALAIESIIGLSELAPTDDPQIKKIDTLLINIRTLVRNLLGAIEGDVKWDLPHDELIDIIKIEMSVIDGIVKDYSDGKVEAIFYHPSYVANYSGRFKYGILKEPKQPKQIYNFQAEEKVGEKIIKDKETIQLNILSLNSDLPKMDVKAIVMTHYPADLLSRYNFTELRLLESHTGAIKGVSLWNTKLQNGRSIPNIPFDRAMLQMFGDGVMFRPAAIKLRRAIVEIAAKHNWTPLSTETLVKHSVKQYKDPFLIEYMSGAYSKSV